MAASTDFCTVHKGYCVKAQAPIYLIIQILELAGTATQDKKTSIIPYYLQLAICEELNKLLG